MSGPEPQFNPADAWEALVAKGLSEKDATTHVMRQIANQPEAVRAQYLKDIDPGKLASFGLGAADMMSFGLGDQVARGLLGETAAMTQEQAKTQHPTAHLLGEAAGLIGPAGIEMGLAKAGKLAPGAIRLLVNSIENRAGRAVAKTALNATIGAGYAGAQAAGHTEGGLGERAKAAGRAAPYGAAAGAVLPLAFSAGRTAVDRLAVRPAKAVGRAVNEVIDRVAGKSVPRTVPLDFDLLPASTKPPVSLLPSAKPVPDPLNVPTFQRRGLLDPPREVIPRAGKPGHPVWQGEGSPTRSPEVRAGEPLVPSKRDVPPPRIPTAAAKILKGQSFAKLKATLMLPETPQAVKQLILAEFQRRGIVIS